jgi:carboxymethylenebutenolidase
MAAGTTIELNGLTGFCAKPESHGGGGVLLLPSHYGINDYARDHVQDLADAGLVALACNQYSGRSSFVPSAAEAVRWGSELNDDVVLQQASTWIGYMLADLGLERVGIIGFCQGGRFALLLAARDPRVAACVSYYPTIVYPMKPNQTLDPLALAGEIRCPVQFIYAAGDHLTVRSTFLSLREQLEQREGATITQVYPGADHGFMTVDEHPGEANAAAVRGSWAQAVAFLQAYTS